MDELPVSLPSPPLRMRHIGDLAPAKHFVHATLFLLLSILPFSASLPTIQEISMDRKSRAAYRPLPEAEITGGCSYSPTKPRSPESTHCRLTIRYAGKTWRREVEIRGKLPDSYTPHAIISTRNPDLVSADFAIANTSGRATNVMLVNLLTLILLGCGLLHLYYALRHRKPLAAMNRVGAYPWRLVAIEGIAAWHEDTHGRLRKIRCAFVANTPWYLNDNDKIPRILAFAARNGKTIIPIDQRLEAISGLDKAAHTALVTELERLSCY